MVDSGAIKVAPLVSIILAIRNEDRHIGRCLASILRQNYPSDQIEVLIADGMSRDRTREIIAEIAAKHPMYRVCVLDNPGLAVPKGLNLSLTKSRGEIIVRVDGRTEIAPDYVSQCVALLSASGADNVGGRREPKANTRVGRAVALGITLPFGIGGGRYLQSDLPQWTDSVYLGAWRREVFDRVGVFDEEMSRNQDDEFNYRLRKSGGRILASPLVRSTYWCRESLIALGRQYYDFGWWKVRVLQKHPRQMSWRQFVPAGFVASLTFVAMSAPFWGAARVLLAFIVATYLATNLAVSLVSGLRYGWRQALLLPAVFATLHLSYGIGFLTGLVRFCGAWRDRATRKRIAANLGGS